MALKKLCDICSGSPSDELNELPRGWARVKLDHRAQMETAEPSTVWKTVTVMDLEVCDTCYALLEDELQAAVGEVMKAVGR